MPRKYSVPLMVNTVIRNPLPCVPLPLSLVESPASLVGWGWPEMKHSGASRGNRHGMLQHASCDTLVHSHPHTCMQTPSPGTPFIGPHAEKARTNITNPDIVLPAFVYADVHVLFM